MFLDLFSLVMIKLMLIKLITEGKWAKQFCVAQAVTKQLEEHPFKAHLGKDSKNSV